MLKRLPAALVILAGVVFLVLVLARNLFPVGNDFEEMIDDFRPLLTDESIESYRTDLAGLAAVGDEFQNAIVPALSAQLGMDPASFMGLMGEQFPDVATGLAVMPQMIPQFSGLIDTLEQQQGNFDSADQIPTKSLPAQSVPWGFTFLGLVAIGVGVMMLLKGGRTWSLVAVVVGAAIIVGSFVLTLPGKSADADALNEALQPVYTVETVEGAKTGIAVLGAMGQQMGTEMLPALGAMLGMQPEDLNQFLGANFPATAQALQTMPLSLVRFGTLATVFDNNLDNYETLKPVKFVPIIWAFIAGGVLMVLGGGYQLVIGSKEEAAAV